MDLTDPAEHLKAKLTQLADSCEEHGGDRYNTMAIYLKRKHHNELNDMAPELWIDFQNVVARKSLALYCREMLSWLQKPNYREEDSKETDFIKKRQRVVIANIERIVVHQLGKPDSSTVKALLEYAQKHL